MDVKTFASSNPGFGIIPARSERAIMHCPEMGTPEQFSALREHLTQCGFNQEGVCVRLGLESPDELDLSTLSNHPPVKRKASDSLDALIVLFILGEFLPTAEAVSFFPGAIWDVLVQTGLVSLDAADADRCFGTVALYPIRDLFIASDRWNNPDRSPRQSFADIVYPSMTRGAREFLGFTSFESCDGFLEICAGTAAGALLASRKSSQVWATDIAERSVRFAKFNAALNDIQNVTIAQGDLFQPVEGLNFERIAAHPPYMPVLRPAEIYYAGGEDGEEITRRIFAELPGFLRRGGRLYCRTLGSDRTSKGFEHRVREWLGEKQAEFDVAVFIGRTVEPRQFALEECVRKRGGSEELVQWEQLFTRHKVEGLLTGMVVVQRASGSRPVFTIRRTMKKDTTPATIEWALRWEMEMQMRGAAELLAGERPLVSPRIALATRHNFREGEVVADDFTLSTDYPFATDCKVQPWMALLLARCDGKTTVEEHFGISKENGWIIPETPPEEFCALLATMVSGGFLQLEKFKWPAAEE
jgi:SAM-dependent methyltransferase